MQGDIRGRHAHIRSRGQSWATRYGAGSGQRVTLPALMHEAQTLSRLGVPDTTTRTR